MEPHLDGGRLRGLPPKLPLIGSLGAERPFNGLIGPHRWLNGLVGHHRNRSCQLRLRGGRRSRERQGWCHPATSQRCASKIGQTHQRAYQRHPRHQIPCRSFFFVHHLPATRLTVARLSLPVKSMGPADPEARTQTSRPDPIGSERLIAVCGRPEWYRFTMIVSFISVLNGTFVPQGGPAQGQLIRFERHD